MTIRASAYRRVPVDAPPDFADDYVEWIRRLADACDGLSGPKVRANAVEILSYRRSVWSPVQQAWAEGVLNR
jgi:hypothetical protein